MAQPPPVPGYAYAEEKVPLDRQPPAQPYPGAVAAASQPGYPPASQPGYPPASQPGYPPASQPGYPPASQSGYPPASQPGYPPASQPGYPPQPQPQPGYPPASQAPPPGYPPAQAQAGYPPAHPQQGYGPSQPGYPPAGNHPPSYDDSIAMRNPPMPQPQAAAAAAPAPTGVQPQYPHAPVAAKAQYPTAHVAAKPIVTAQPVQYVMQPQPQVNVVRTGRGGGTTIVGAGGATVVTNTGCRQPRRGFTSSLTQGLGFGSSWFGSGQPVNTGGTVVVSAQPQVVVPQHTVVAQPQRNVTVIRKR